MRWEQGPCGNPAMEHLVEAWYLKDENNHYYALVFMEKMSGHPRCRSVCHPTDPLLPKQCDHSDKETAFAYIESLMPNLEMQIGPDTKTKNALYT